MNPNDAYYAGVTLHELGHYALGVRDEYEGDDWDPDNGPPRCTLQSSDIGTVFSSGGDKDACFMRGAHDMNKKKLCSAHPDNPYSDGTEQGPQDCWSDVVRRFDDSLPFHVRRPRWRLQTPTSRGVIIGRLPPPAIIARMHGIGRHAHADAVPPVTPADASTVPVMHHRRQAPRHVHDPGRPHTCIHLCADKRQHRSRRRNRQ